MHVPCKEAAFFCSLINMSVYSQLCVVAAYSLFSRVAYLAKFTCGHNQMWTQVSPHGREVEHALGMEERKSVTRASCALWAQ